MGINSPGKTPAAEKHKPPPRKQVSITEYPSLESTARLSKKEARKEILKRKRDLELQIKRMAATLEEAEDYDDDG